MMTAMICNYRFEIRFWHGQNPIWMPEFRKGYDCDFVDRDGTATYYLPEPRDDRPKKPIHPISLAWRHDSMGEALLDQIDGLRIDREPEE